MRYVIVGSNSPMVSKKSKGEKRRRGGDELDVMVVAGMMTIVSMIHRRLDDSHVPPRV